jgi:aryl-alcohol dehydrogenase-like predicted oxidoreductase
MRLSNAWRWLDGSPIDFRADRSERLPGFDYRIDRHYIRWACEQSQRRLRKDHIDICLCCAGSAEPDDEMREVLEGLVVEGEVRTYNWSAQMAGRIRFLGEGENGHAAEVAVNVLNDPVELIDVSDELDLGVLVRSPLANGLLGKPPRRPICTSPSEKE